MSRLTELAAIGYGAYSRHLGSEGEFERLPVRAREGWESGVRAILEDIYRDQEAAKKPLTVEALDEAVGVLQGIPDGGDMVVPVHPDSILGRAMQEEAVASAELAQKPAGHSAVRKPRK